MRRFSPFIRLFSLALLLAAPAAVSFAQESVGLKIQPAEVRERVQAGQVIEQTLYVTNQTAAAATYYFDLQDISGINEAGQPIFDTQPGEPTGYEVASWVSVPGDSITVGPRATVEVPVTIAVPSDASPGSHYGYLFLVSRAPKLRESGAGVGYQVGMKIELRIDGDVLEEARIRDFYTDKLIFFSSSTVQFTANIENVGNVIVRPRGPITVTSMFGREVTPPPRMNDLAAAVLPNQARTFIETWTPDGFAFGRYTAVLALGYGEDGRKTMSSATAFWVLPMKVIVPVIVTLLAVVLFLYAAVRFHVSRKVNALATASGVRIERTVPRDPGLSRLTVIAVALLSFLAIFLLVLFVLFA